MTTEAIQDYHPEHWDQSEEEMNDVLPAPTHLSPHSLMKSDCYQKNGSCTAIRISKPYKPVLHV